MSNRHIVKTNQYFSSEKWTQMEAELKNRAWRDARFSSQSKRKNFFDKVKFQHQLKSAKLKVKNPQKNFNLIIIFISATRRTGRRTWSDCRPAAAPLPCLRSRCRYATRGRSSPCCGPSPTFARPPPPTSNPRYGILASVRNAYEKPSNNEPILVPNECFVYPYHATEN